MGHVHLSFEYHIHKSCLKIRIWQLSDILLPPPQISMIQSVYVRSFLTPSNSKSSIQRTEEVRVENLEAHINVKAHEKKPSSGIQHVFTPSNFKFLTPLEYSNINVDVVREKSIQIEVCMIQKSSRKSFMIGMINIPLKKAVKIFVREKIPLIPCLNYTTPNNMRVYSATDLDLEGNGDLFYTSQSLKELNGHMAPAEFEEVMVPDENLIKPVHINIRKKRDSNDNEVKVENGDTCIKNETKSPSKACENIQKSKEGSEQSKVNTKNESNLKTEKDKKLIKVNLDDLEISDMVTNGIPNSQEKIEHLESNNGKTKLCVPLDLVIDDSDHELEETLSGLKVTSPTAVPSRPETPVWDYYDFDFEEGRKPKQKQAKNSTSSTKSTDSEVTRSN